MLVSAIITSGTTATPIPVPANAFRLRIWRSCGTGYKRFSVLCHMRTKRRFHSSIWCSLLDFLLWLSIGEILNRQWYNSQRHYCDCDATLIHYYDFWQHYQAVKILGGAFHFSLCHKGPSRTISERQEGWLHCKVFVSFVEKNPRQWYNFSISLSVAKTQRTFGICQESFQKFLQ